jgi:hypothetical protein
MKKMKNLIVWLVSLSICFVLVFSYLTWLGQYEEREAINILASREPELGLPIYSQFVVTQRIKFNRLTSVLALSFPVYFSSEDKKLQVEVLKDGRLVDRWRYVPKKPGEVEEAWLLVRPAKLLEGEVEIRFGAEDVSHEEKEEAPRIFADTEDAAYPDGNYRIAENEKKGDVGLKVIERVSRWDKKVDFWSEKPLELAMYAAKLLLVLLMVSALPFVIA